MTGDNKKTKTNLFRYYRHRRKEAGSNCKRNGSFINADRIEAGVWDWLVDLLTDPTNLKIGLEELKSSSENSMEEKTRRLKELERKMEDLENQISNYVDELTNHNDELIRAIIRRKIDGKLKAHQSLSKDQKVLQAEISKSEDYEVKQQDIFVFAKEVGAGIEHANYKGKRRILDLLDVRVEYFYENGTKKAVVSCVISPEKACIEFPRSRHRANLPGYQLRHRPQRRPGRSRRRT